MQKLREFLYPQSFLAEPTSTISARQHQALRDRWNVSASNYCRSTSNAGLWHRLNSLLNP